MTDDDPAFDLQAFVREYGGVYSAITAEAWAAWDRKMAERQERRRLTYLGAATAANRPLSPPKASAGQICICGARGLHSRPRKAAAR